MIRYDRKKVPVKVYQKLEMQIIPTRHEASIFTSFKIQSDTLIPFLKEHDLKIFPWVLYACLQTVKAYPHLRRFIMKGILYEHKHLTISTMIKKDKKVAGDNGFGKFILDESMSAHDIQKMFNNTVSSSRSESGNASDTLMKVMGIFPTAVFRLVKNILMLLDRFDLLPNSIIDSDPLHATAMIANLGSIDGHSVYHHLYNWGTISLFITFGRLQSDGSLDITFTIDERISEGMVLFKAVEHFRKIMENPYEHV